MTVLEPNNDHLARHPELVSWSEKMLKQVQHDVSVDLSIFLIGMDA